jgi:hypothetical protein
MGNFARPDFSDPHRPVALEEQPAVFEGPCAGCRWPDTCAKDRRCWRPDLANKEETMDDADETAAVATVHETTCKIDGCEEPAVQRRGLYGGLCREHRDRRRSNGAAPSRPAKASGETELVVCAREVEEAKRDLQAARERLKAQLDRLTSLLQEARA